SRGAQHRLCRGKFRQEPAARRHASLLARRELMAQPLELADWHEWDEAQEEQEQQAEERDAAAENRPVYPRRPVQVPTRRQEVAVERGDDEDESLQPH